MPAMTRHAVAAVGIDTGGTFTDAVLEDAAGRRTTKVPSTPHAPEEAFLHALTAVDGLNARVRHGTTVGTNAVLTRRGARVVFVTTAGFEDLPWLGRGVRADLHALAPCREAPLAVAAVGVRARTGPAGRAEQALEPEELTRVAASVRAKRPEAVAVCLLHAARGPAHERRVGRALRALGVPVYLSSTASADPREGERGATAILAAYVAPTLRRYLDAVARGLAPSSRAALTLMRSDGGRMAKREVFAQPARTLLSGPAAGVSAAQDLARRHALPRAMSFDVGGTSTDVAWIEGDDVPVRAALQVGPFSASVPSVGIETVGAGGGSLIWLDSGGALRVGPQSAGAVPGPACYGQGGGFTLTDAWLLGGRLPEALLDGAHPLDAAAAERGARVLARAAGTSVRALCEGAIQVAAASTARALRLASVAHGHDPREAGLIAFGGAGPVLAAETAARLGMPRVYIPVDPGLLAAEGALRAPLRADATELVGAGRRPDLGAVRGRLEKGVRRTLEREGARGVRVRADLEARYGGQAFTVSVPLSVRWQAAFHRQHERRYGFATPARAVEVVSVTVRGLGREGASRRVAPLRSVRTRRVDRRAVHRADLDPGARLRGPARIDELSGTTWVPKGWQADVLADGVLRLGRAR